MKKDLVYKNLKSLREGAGLKQKQLAKSLGISPNYYSQIENGHRSIQINHILKLSKFYNVTLDDIFFNEEIAKCDKQKCG